MFFLRLKHWQLFLISWAPLSQFFILLFTGSDLLNYFPVVLFLFLAGLTTSFIWVWQIVSKLKALFPVMNFGLFRVAFCIPCAYSYMLIFFLLYNLYVQKTNMGITEALFLSLPVISIACIFYGLAFIGRLIRAVELKKMPSLKEYILTSVIMLLPPLGLWFVQPRLNRIVNSYSGTPPVSSPSSA
jgi:hypothetical protein